MSKTDACSWKTHRTPAPLEEGREEVDANKCNIAGGADRLACLRRSDAHEDTDVHHRHTHGDRSPEERLATSEGVGCEDQEEAAHDHLNDAVNTGGEETDLRAVKAEVLEDLGSVYVMLVADASCGSAFYGSHTVVTDRQVSAYSGKSIFRVHLHGVGTCHLLTNHQSDGKKSTLAVARDGPHLSHQVLEGGVTNESALVIELILDLGQLSSNVRVGRRQVANAGEDSRGFVPTVLTCEPTGRLVAEPHGCEEQHSRKTLHDQGNDVLRVAFEVRVGAVVNPESKHDSGSDEELVNTGQTATDGTRSVLRNYDVGQYNTRNSVSWVKLTVQRGDHGSSTNTKTSNESAYEDSGNVTRGSSLHDRSNDGENSRADQVETATDFVRDKSSAESTNKATALQGGHDVGLKVGELNTLLAGETISPDGYVSFATDFDHALRGVLLLEGFHGQDTADDTRVHTEQHATEASLSLSARISDAVSLS